MTRQEKFYQTYWQGDDGKWHFKSSEDEAQFWELFKQLGNEQEWKCFYCGIPLKRETTGIHVDHKHPVSRGGSDEKHNLCLACEKCNLSKGNQTEIEYKSRMGIPIPEETVEPHLSIYTVGTILVHPKFGEGEIIKLTPRGKDVELTIMFADPWNMKLISARIAHPMLKIVTSP